MAENSVGRAMDEIYGSIGRQINLETNDGITRQGRLSGWRTRSMKFNSRTVDIPFALELNGDQMDTVDLDRIAKLDVK